MTLPKIIHLPLLFKKNLFISQRCDTQNLDSDCIEVFNISIYFFTKSDTLSVNWLYKEYRQCKGETCLEIKCKITAYNYLFKGGCLKMFQPKTGSIQTFEFPAILP